MMGIPALRMAQMARRIFPQWRSSAARSRFVRLGTARASRKDSMAARIS